MTVDIYDLAEVVVNNMGDSYSLTQRERELILNLSLNGSSNQEIAEEFNVTQKTIKNHLTNILNKTKLKSSRELQALIFCNTLSFINK